MKFEHTPMIYATVPGDLPSVARSEGSHESFKRAMDRYRPDPLRLLFIAEAPPAYKANRFFYFHEVQTGDALFLEMMKVVYGDAIGFTEGGGFTGPTLVKDVRRCKPRLLRRFMVDGLFLIDASERPMPENATASVKLALLQQSLPRLKVRLKSFLCDRSIPIVLIGRVTYEACFASLKEDGYHVVNEGMINHPARGGQLLFRKKLRETLKCVARMRSDAV
jgi:hypothetical protein